MLIEFNPSQNSNNVEDANQYLVQWSTSPTLGGGTDGGQFGAIAGSHTFTAHGDNGVWILDNATLAGSGFSFTSGKTYYFQARSFNTLDTANPHPSGWCNYTSSGCSGTSGFTGVTIGTPACTGTCTAVSSSVTIPAAITIKAGAPLYLGLVQLDSSGNPKGIYVTEIASPQNGANNFAVTVPSGSNYAVVGILDQNNNGGFAAGTVYQYQRQPPREPDHIGQHANRCRNHAAYREQHRNRVHAVLVQLLPGLRHDHDTATSLILKCGSQTSCR